MMPFDYQLLHCLLTYTLALTHAHRASKTGEMTPEYILRLWVPLHSHVLPNLGKVEMLQVRIPRQSERIPCGVQVDPEQPIKYKIQEQHQSCNPVGDSRYDINTQPPCVSAVGRQCSWYSPCVYWSSTAAEIVIFPVLSTEMVDQRGQERAF